MLASSRRNHRSRRGVVLILILGVLALMAIIGVTFATFSGQSRISARNFAQSLNRPLQGELMDFALSQLIGDTSDIRSAIRGHSLARDMYGNDAANNGYLTSRPGGAGTTAPYNYSLFYVVKFQQVGTSNLYDMQTNLALNDSALYGYNFTRWVLRLEYVGPVPTGTPMPVDQTFEVVFDDYANALGSAVADNTHRVLRVSPVDSQTYLNNPTLAALNSNVNWSNGTNTAVQPPSSNLNYPFTLDGRYLRAFNGPGMAQNSVYGNFKYNGLLLGQTLPVGDPSVVGMDEDYDAVDLENWFLAMQSADGTVIIPSFHRPGILRYDYANLLCPGVPTSDWNVFATDSPSRILRPRGADHPAFAASFPDPVPGTTGTIMYDVDNDGDGETDSVWVDLGYPTRTDEKGQLFKPLFAFMVIGLNGRIPLNTAGNIAGQNSVHASHLGNSPSEIDPTYALQNAGSFDLIGLTYSQTDNAGVDVRLTQLRNLLTGTRPNPTPNQQGQGGPNPPFGDLNWVALDSRQYYMPNGQFDANPPVAPADVANGTDPFGNPAAVRNTQPVSGRWGEADLVPGFILTTATNYTSKSRAGLSRGYTGGGALAYPRDADDDNLNVFDPYPLRNPSATPHQLGEVMDQDLYDASGGLILSVERNRRFVTPMDINGTGQIVNFKGGSPTSGAQNRGGDQWGRVAHYSYFRPPGLPGIIDTNPTSTTVGAIGYIPGVTQLYRNSGDPAIDTTNNLTHAFDFFRFPTASPVRLGGMPLDLNAGTAIPTYDLQVAGSTHPPSDGLDEADEMNLYQPTSIDDPFGMGDLDWLYRKQDIDGAQLSSRLATLAPISFADKSNTFGQGGHGIRHRRLFSIDTWETNSASWANDNPGGAFPANSRFLPLANADLANVNVTTANITGNPTYPWAQFSGGVVPTNPGGAITPDPVPVWPVPAPSIAHRDRRINLNFPLPVSNDPNEPVRQKWISEAYQLLKAVLPPKSIDTPEELAQLSQFLVNVIDFRDPDAAMTHFMNPDVNISFTGTAPTLAFATTAAPANLDQYGMEYNPIALNEVLLYSYVSLQSGAAAETGRFFVELVNTLTASATPNTTASPPAPPPGWPFNTSSTLDLGGSSYTANDPYNGGSWDLVFTADSANSRPDPYTGQLNPTGAGLYYGLIPLNKDAFGAANGNANAVDVKANPLATAGLPTLPTTQTTPVPTTYPYVFGSPTTAYDLNPPNPTPTPPTPPSLVQSLDKTFDPVGTTNTSTFTFRPGVLPGITAVSTTYPPPGATGFTWKLPLPMMQTGSGTIKGPGTITFYWVCLRRPAEPFQPVSLTNPMVVVDAMRVPYIDGTGLITTGSPATSNLTKANDIYSVRRWQPYRGGQAVPPGIGTAPIDPHYGYTEQIVPPATGGPSATQGYYDATNKVLSTNPIYHTLGSVATGAGTENWDYLPFHDRDFTSVAELMLVPGCPPGLFTKQFVENVPTATPPFPTPTPLPTVVTATPLKVARVPSSPALTANLHTYPYLSDKFFYTAVSDATVAAQTVDGYTSAGWHKMFEFFEVPSQANGSVGPIAHGANFDWQRQDLRPGLLNLNLIMDEEVFLSLLGSHDNSFNELFLNSQVVTPGQPPVVPLSPLQLPRVVTGVDPHGTPLLPTTTGVSGSYEYQSPGYITNANPAVKAAFAQFLKVRHGGSGFLFAWGSGATGTPDPAYTPPPANNAHLAVASERPFRSLSFPDVDYTVMRPAALPPSLYSFPVLNTTPGPGTYANDPGWKNNNLFPGYPTATLPTILVPPPIPTRRLFQIPDSNTASNASESGDTYVNVQSATTPATTTGSIGTLSNNNVNLVSPIPIPPGNVVSPVPIPRVTYAPELGAATGGAGDNSQNPYFRSEMLQRVMNLTTVRTHQYAVWITVGFFRVTQQGDPSLGFGNQAFDQLGAEVGLPGGKQVRYRAFFVVDRTKLIGFDPSSPGNYRDAIVYRQNIQ